MRFLTRFSLLLLAAFVVLFSAGCDPDNPGGGGGGGVTLPPVISLNSGAGLVSFNQELPLATPSFIVNLSVEDGDGALRDLTIQEQGTNIPFSQLNFRTGQTANNPLLIPAADQGGFTYEIEITPSNTAAGDVTFSFLVTDTNGESASTQVTITYTANPPLIDLLVADGFVSGDATITNFNTSFDVQVALDDTEDSLATLTILEDGVVMDAANLTYNNGAFTSMNPLALIPAEAVGVTYTITVNPDVTMQETRTYTFQVADVDGITAERSVVITFDPPEGTMLTFDTTGVFFNASGAMFGGLDLDNGTAVPFNSADAEIEDEGLDNTIAVGMENWRTQISASNDAELRIADLSVLGDGVTFDDVVFAEEIAQVFTGGNAELGGSDDFNFQDIPGDDSDQEVVTTPLQAGDVFAVQRNGRSYLIRIDEVNFVASSNNDNYKISIKY